MHLDFQGLMKNNPDLRDRLDSLPGRLFSGKAHIKSGTKAVFFCYALPAPRGPAEKAEGLDDGWSLDSGASRWYLYDIAAEQITEDAPAINGVVRCDADTPRRTEIAQPTLTEIRQQDREAHQEYVPQAGAGPRRGQACPQSLDGAQLMAKSRCTANADRIRQIKTFPSLVKYLRDELNWPIEANDFEDLTYDWEPEELGIDKASAAKIDEVKQLRPLADDQPWGIFFVKFEPKQLPVVALRRLLNSMVIRKRESANKSERQAWAMNDLMFISSYGDSGERHISFAHFSQPEGKNDLPTLKVLGWDNSDTPLHLDLVASKLTAMPRMAG